MKATADEIAAVYESFQQVNKNSQNTGKAFFQRLFELYPELQHLFSHLQPTGSSLFDSSKFQTHYEKVINSIAALIDNLRIGEEEKNEATLNRLVTIHKNWKVKSEHIDCIKITFLDLLNLERGSCLETAWNNVLDYLFEAFKQKLAVAWSRS